MNASSEQRTGRGGWPLGPSLKFPGELWLACPRCRSTNVTIGCHYGVGPDGRQRLGNPGGLEENRCQDCGMLHYFKAEQTS